MTATLVRTLRRGIAPLAIASTVGAGACAPAISTQQEQQLGAQYAAEINRQLPIVDDAQINGYINDLGRQIARPNDPRGIPYTFRVVNASQVNAFAVPGGYVYVNRGLIERADNMSELAGVLAHEIGHVVERHSVEQMQKMQNAQLGVALGTILLGQPSQLGALGINAVGSAVFAGFSRDAEREADQVAVTYLVRSGINPRGMVTFFQKLLDEQQRNPGALEQWFSTHPTTQERIADVQRIIQQTPGASRPSLTENTQAFQTFKSRVARLPAPPKQQRRR